MASKKEATTEAKRTIGAAVLEFMLDGATNDRHYRNGDQSEHRNDSSHEKLPSQSPLFKYAILGPRR